MRRGFLRESFMLHAGIREVSYLWGEELAFCSKFAPFVGPRNIEPLIAEIESAAAQIAQNGNPTIVFTHFALSVSKMIKTFVTLRTAYVFWDRINPDRRQIGADGMRYEILRT